MANAKLRRRVGLCIAGVFLLLSVISFMRLLVEKRSFEASITVGAFLFFALTFYFAGRGKHIARGPRG